MKKIVLTFLFILGSIAFVNAQEDDSNWLDSFLDEDEMILEQNEKIVQEEKDSERDKLISKNRKKENRVISGYICTGVNIPFNFDMTIEEKSGSTFPFGISLHGIGNQGYIAFKGNVNCDFIKYSKDSSVLFSCTLSLGLTPMHNEFCYIGLFGTFGIDEIDNYTYPSYGGSGTVIFNFAKRWGILINCDATCRQKGEYKGEKKIDPPAPHFVGSWRVCPSIGFTYNFI